LANRRIDERIGENVYNAARQCPTLLKLALEIMSAFGDECLSFPATLFMFIFAFAFNGLSIWTGIAAELFGDLGFLSFCEQLFKLITKRPRPKYAHQGSFYVLYGEHFSCPSGHTMRAFFLAIFIAFSPLWQKHFYNIPTVAIRITCLLMALGTGLARVAKGRHFPSDCILGSFFGIVFALLAIQLGPFAWATVKYPFGIIMCLEALAVCAIPAWRTKGFIIHVLIATLWCFSTRLGLGAWGTSPSSLPSSSSLFIL